MRTEYKYQVGEVVNDTLKILEQTRHGKQNRKSYVVQSLVYPDAPTYKVSEASLKKRVGCAYKMGRRVYEGNSIYSIERLRPYLVDIEGSKNIKPYSNKPIIVKCPSCNKKKSTRPYTLVRQGFSCPRCSKGTSYPELFMMAYLEVKGIEYEYQKVFDDLPNRRFDFYLPKDNKVIETHGIQHYTNSRMFRYKQTSISDKDKRSYCSMNNIVYIEIDSRESSFKFIKNNINQSILPTINKREEQLIITHIETNKRYPVKEIIKLYEEGKSTTEISKEYNVSWSTIMNILKRHNVAIRDTNKIRSKSIRCITEDKVFPSVSEASRYYNVPRTNILKVLKGKRKSAGKHLLTGEKLQWEYVD